MWNPQEVTRPKSQEAFDKLWKLKKHYETNDQGSTQKSFARHLEYSLACARFNFTMEVSCCAIARWSL